MNLTRLFRRWRGGAAPAQRFILTENIVIPAGAELKRCDELGAGGLEATLERGCVRVFIGRAAGLRDGMIVAKPVFKVVE